MRMIYGVKSADQYVYHYTSAETARDLILKDRTLRMGRILDTNDPKETMEWEFNLWTAGSYDLGKYKMDEVSKWLSSALKANVRVACFCQDRAPLKGDHVGEILQRGFAKSRMWAQYGKNHSGVCLVFDRSKLLESVKTHLDGNTCWVGNVSYRDHFVVRSLSQNEFMIDVDELELVGPERYVANHLIRHHDELFFEKLQDWRDETEWRMMVIGPGSGAIFLPVEQALVGVMHGASTNQKISEQIMELTDDNTVEHMGLIWKNGNPWYDLGSLKWSNIDRNSPWHRVKGGA